MRLKAAALLSVISLGLMGIPAGAGTAASAPKAPPGVTISSPVAGSTVAPGDVTVQGTVGSAVARKKDYVLFNVDVSSSTGSPSGMDCNGDHKADVGDDLNGDGNEGDILDCEISSVIKLNQDLASSPDADTQVQVGVEVFAESAELAQMSTTAGETFISPLRADASPRNVEVVASSITQVHVGQYVPKPVRGGTNFDAALDTALTELAGHDGNKWLFFMSDGESSVSQETLNRLTSSGIKVRTYAVGAGTGDTPCADTAPLGQIARASGETCTPVDDPTKLAANLTGSQPGDVQSVTVSGLGADLPASIDALGNWTAKAPTVAAGDYTATAIAKFTDGTSATAAVTFKVGTVTNTNVVRWAGVDRYDASAQISAESFQPGVPTAYIASGLVFTDALSGSPVAGKTPGPMLLVRTDEIPDSVKTELARLKPQNIVILGGRATVTAGVEQVLNGYTAGKVTRWDGADRYEASAKISAKSFDPGVDTAFVASGLIFTDALSGSPIAGHTPGPMLLVKTDEIPAAIKAELTRLKPTRIVVLGGLATISGAVQEQLKSYVGGQSVDRWDGLDRYEASARIAVQSFRPKVDTAFIASGLIFTDALSGSPIAGHTPGPMLLVKTDEIPPAIETALERLKPRRIVILGGTATISAGVEQALGAFTRTP